MRAFWLVALVLSCAACSTHPLPQDVTGYNTSEIVRKIRCETRDAVKKRVLDELDKYNPQLAARVRAGTAPLRDLNQVRNILRKEVRTAFDKYDQSAVAYDFTFDITENNKVTTSANLTNPFSRRGPLTIGPSATDDQTRQNLRNFRTADTFEELVTKLDDYCARSQTTKNWSYPITGTIGISELVDSFLDLNESGSLTNKPPGPNIPTIADTITFTTKFSASANPSIALKPLGHGLDLTSATLAADASRSDKHQVIVTISLPAEKGRRIVKAAGADARAASVKSAYDELDVQIYRNALSRGILVLPPP